MLFSLLLLAAAPYCAGSVDEDRCQWWMASDMLAEHQAHPELDIEALEEISSERIPNYFWSIE